MFFDRVECSVTIRKNDIIMLWVNNLVLFAAIVSSSSCLGSSEVSYNNDPKSQSRRTKLRQKRYAPVTDSETSSPTLTECLYSATTSEDCDKKEGCVWCSEPVSGLCLTQEWANKMSFLPFLKCDDQTTTAAAAN